MFSGRVLRHATPALLLAAFAMEAQGANITVPDGFRVEEVARDLGSARHIAVRDNGDIYVSLDSASGKGRNGSVVALRDSDGDGKPDQTEYFGSRYGTGILIHDGYLYHQADLDIERWKLPTDGSLVPTGEPEPVVSGFPEQGEHQAKAIAIDNSGHLYVSIGAPSNSCQEQNRSKGSMGMQPCPQLDTNAGVWRFPAGKTGLHFSDGQRFATGLRHCVAMTYDPHSKAVWVVMHGRDQLHSLFPDYYTAEENARLPAEELHKLEQGLDAGWPYTYWDPARKQRMLAPEYGGNGETPVREGMFAKPDMAFPAHWAPNDMIFYKGSQFPERYKNGLFVAFHGSWNRAPFEQGGYKVLFVPMNAQGEVAGEYETFADGFAGTERLMNPRNSEHRVCGVAMAPDGSLYICDDKAGYLWRVTYEGSTPSGK